MLEAVFVARLGHYQKYSSFFSGTIIFEAVFSQVWVSPKNIVPFFSGTIIFEAVFFFRFGCPPKNIVPFFPQL